jgi:excisionase family DNA binding protein
MIERTYTLRRVSELLGVNVCTVRRWVRTGKLPAIGEPYSRRVKESDLKAILASVMEYP